MGAAVISTSLPPGVTVPGAQEGPVPQQWLLLLLLLLWVLVLLLVLLLLLVLVLLLPVLVPVPQAQQVFTIATACLPALLLLLPAVAALNLPVQLPLLAAVFLRRTLVLTEVQLLVVVHLAGTGGPALGQALVILKALQRLLLDDGRRHHYVLLTGAGRGAVASVT